MNELHFLKDVVEEERQCADEVVDEGSLKIVFRDGRFLKHEAAVLVVTSHEVQNHFDYKHIKRKAIQKKVTCGILYLDKEADL